MYHKLIFKGAVIIFFANVFSFVLGYIRDVLIVKNFGASSLTDAWYIASNIPELLFKFLLFGTLGATFIPVFIEYLAKEKEEEAWEIASSIINLSVLILAGLTVLGILFSSHIVFLFAPGFDHKTHLLATQLTQIILPLLVIFAAGGLLGAIYQAYYNYLLPSLTSIINVILLLIIILIFSQTWGIFSVAWGTIIGYVVSFALLVSFLAIYKKPYKFRVNLQHPAIKEILFLIIPLIGAEVIGKGIGVVDRIFSSYLENGAITALNLANRMITIPVTFFSTTVAAVVFPVLARNTAGDKRKDFSKTFFFSAKMSLLLITPCIAGIITLGKPLIRVLFEHGKFGVEATEITWQALFFLSWGLIAFSLRPILARACYALKKNWMLLRYEVVGFMLNFVLDYILIKYLGIAGIALATTIAVSITISYLFYMIWREIDRVDIKGITSFSYKVFGASVIMGGWCYLVFHYLEIFVFPAPTMLFLNLLISIFSGGLIYLAILKILDLEELTILWDTMRESYRKVKEYKT
jgi:putative peptidoglycan lipid II flippase